MARHIHSCTMYMSDIQRNLLPLVNTHTLRLNTSSLSKRGKEESWAGAGKFIFIRKISFIILISLLWPVREKGVIFLCDMYAGLYPAFMSRSKRRLLAIRGRNERKTGEERMRIVSAISWVRYWGRASPLKHMATVNNVPIQVSTHLYHNPGFMK